MNPIDRLIAAFEKFPGIGPRQARRFVQYLLTQQEGARKELSQVIQKLGQETKLCTRCYRWFVKNGPSAQAGGAEKLCSICSNARRDKNVLFVVEKDADLDNVERSGFLGLYFVLGGAIPLASETPEKYIRLKELLARAKEEEVKEIILGLSATTEGDHTRLILQEKLKNSDKKISSLGRGLSTGSELEYADPDTIQEALGNRH